LIFLKSGKDLSDRPVYFFDDIPIDTGQGPVLEFFGPEKRDMWKGIPRKL
jgi:hypothetical protein